MDLFRQVKRIAPTAVFAAVIAACLVASAEPPAETPAAAPDETPTAAAAEAPEAPETVETIVPGSTPGVIKELHMRDTDIRSALELFSRRQRVNIVATKNVTGDVAAVDLYDATFEEALRAVLHAAGYTYYREAGAIYVCTPKELADRKKAAAAAVAAEREIVVKPFRLAYITATDARALIEPVLSPDGQITITPAADSGIPESSTDAGGNSYAAEDVLVVRDYIERIEEVAALLEEIDVRPPQILIEATILRATLTEDTAMGIDFNALAGVDFESIGSTSAGLQDLTTGTVAGTGLNDGQATFRTDFNSAVDPGGLTIGFVSNNMGFFVRALESVTDVTVLANPKLLVINKQRGEVMVGSRDGYLTTTVTETTATQTVEFLETGTRLVVRPYVGKDGEIRLEIHPEDSSGSVEQVGGSVLPSESTTEVTTNVIVRDGRTIVIGGLFRERTDRGRTQVPLVGNLPHLGAMFRQTSNTSEREEVIILITPHIIQQDKAEEVGDQYLDEVERIRIGMRKGLHWWGRERLAQSSMRAARKALAEKDRENAMWHLDTALALSPRMIEAVRMKERLTERAYWDEHTRHSAARHLVERLVMHDLGVPVERVIPRRKPMHPERELSEDVRDRLGIDKRHEDPIPVEYRPQSLTDVLDGPAGDEPVAEPAAESVAEPATGGDTAPDDTAAPVVPAEPADD